MLIRPLTPADARAFWALRLRGFEESPTSFNTEPDEWRAHPVPEAEQLLGHATGTPDDVVLGAFDAELVAHMGLRREPRRKRSHKAKLWGLYVAPEARGHGVGLRLVEALVERARKMPGLTVLELTVMAGNARALAIYHRVGFRRFGYQERATKIDDIYVAEEHLMLDLDAALGKK
jgi:ribosomal protein S18 acetylase RimI-like enzyme